MSLRAKEKKMTGGGFAGTQKSERAQQYKHKITWYFLFSCLLGCVGGSVFGCDLGVSGGVTCMDDFLVKFFPKVYETKHAHLQETNYCKYDNHLLTLFTSSLCFAALVTTFGASYVTRKNGRRASIIVGTLNFLTGAIMNAAAQNIAMLIIGRILLGAGIGFDNKVKSTDSHYMHFSIYKI